MDEGIPTGLYDLVMYIIKMLDARVLQWTKRGGGGGGDGIPSLF